MLNLTELGWSDHFAKHWDAEEGLAPARVIAEHRSTYRVQSEQRDLVARTSGRLRHQAESRGDLPVVGDWVAVQTADDEATIHRVLPRKSKFSRKTAGERTEEQLVAANIDIVWIVTAADADFNLRRLERYLTLCWDSGASPVIVLNKVDLAEQPNDFVGAIEELSPGLPVHATSGQNGLGLDALRGYFHNHATVALLGSSGVGKSTLINALAGTTLQRTRPVREDGKGRHTTIHRQLIHLPGGGLIIDTPGMRELQLWESSSGLSETFQEIDQLALECRFSDCLHTTEPDCAVQLAIERGELPLERLRSFQKLQRELAHLERKQDALAQLQEKKRIKSIMKSVKHHWKRK